MCHYHGENISRFTVGNRSVTYYKNGNCYNRRSEFNITNLGVFDRHEFNNFINITLVDGVVLITFR